MTITMNNVRFESVADLAAFTKAAGKIEFENLESIAEKCSGVEAILTRFRYFSITKKAKGEVRRYLTRMTGYSASHLTRLIKKKQQKGKIKRSTEKRNTFGTTYTTTDIALLLKTDNAHSRISGPATKEIMERELTTSQQADEVYGGHATPSNTVG